MGTEQEYKFKSLISGDEKVDIPTATLKDIVRMATLATEGVSEFLENHDDYALLNDALTKLGFIKGAAMFYLPK